MALASAKLAQTHPQKTALADNDSSLSWLELNSSLNRFVNGLLDFPFGPERRMAVFATNSKETVLAYLASLHAGVSAVPINSHLTEEEVAYILKESETELLFVSAETAEIGKRAAELTGDVKVIVWGGPAPEGTQSCLNWLDQMSSDEPRTDVEPKRYLQFTSGTTGFPKAIDAVATTLPVAKTTEEFFDLMREWTAARPEGPHLALGPLYFNASLHSVRMLAAGHPLIVMRSFDAETVLSLIDTYKVVTTLMVPTHFKRLLALPEAIREKYDLSSLQSVTHTGAACPREVKQAMIDWVGPILIEAYGGTESGTTNVIDSHEWQQHPGSVGKTVDNFELLIYGENGELLGPNEPGEIYFRDKLGKGIVYRNAPEKTKAAHREPGVFTLGDIGYYDEEGFLYITDRVSDMIVSGGVNIYPAEIEQVLLGHDLVDDAVVIGVPNADFGEEVKALIVPKDKNAPPDPAQILAYLRKRLAGYKCPRSIDFVDDVGRTPAGKVNKRVLRASYWPTERTIG
ncbi:AMP-binding protein [Henriciella litoralis]|uniref:AMP-binding protein n=1 Tax=Henriciella litoralis TaxID=568102 RepID=UPI0009FED4E1|nr:AMP-binding protein [Henriciella litoralis]